MHVEIPVNVTAEIAAANGAVLRIAPGTIHGRLTIAPTTNATGGVIPFVTSVLDYIAADGQPVRCSTTVPATSVLPNAQAPVVPTVRRQNWDFALMATLHDGATNDIVFADGYWIWGLPRGSSFTLMVDCDGSALDAYLKLASDDARATRGFLELGYRLPLDAVLQLAHTPEHGEAPPERQLSRLNKPPQGLPVSPSIQVKF